MTSEHPRSTKSQKALRLAGFVRGLAIVLTAAGAADVGAQQLCPLTEFVQITDTVLPVAHQSPAIDAGGRRVVFYSNSDPTGGNPDGNHEIFLYEATAATVSQITSTTGSNNIGSQLSANGTLIVFHSSQDFTGGNGDGNREVFLYDTVTASFSQITTSSPPVRSQNPHISGDGLWIAFESDGDHTGGNGDGSWEIFLYDVAGASFSQLTDDPDPARYAARSWVDQDGGRVVFDGDIDPTGQNPDRNQEVFLYDAGTIIQVTISSGGSNGAPAVSRDGQWVALQSPSDLTGGNPDGSSEVFLYEVATATTTQLTDTSPADGTGFPSLDSQGSVVAFRSGADLTGGNPDGSTEIFLLHMASGELAQVTDGPTGLSSQQVALDDSGSHMAITSEADLTGGNPDGNAEVFLAMCGVFSDGFESGDTSAWSNTVP